MGLGLGLTSPRARIPEIIGSLKNTQDHSNNNQIEARKPDNMNPQLQPIHADEKEETS